MSPLPPPDIWMQTLAGRAMDLMAPTADMVDLFGELPDVLARLPRFCGHTQSGPYSVAQHCVVGADTILSETGDVALAQSFLLHDAHEGYIGDHITPLAQAIQARTGLALARLMPGTAEQARRTGQGLAKEALTGLKRDLDKAIFEAAGLPWPLAENTALAVLEWDLRMLQVERIHLMAPSPHPWAPGVERVPPARLSKRLRPLPWPDAADAFRDRLARLFPHLCPPRAA